MRNYLAIIAGCISVIGAIPYIIDTLKGKTHPNLVTWFTWTLLNAINAWAAWSAGAVQTTIFSVAAGIATVSILIVGLHSGVKHFSKFDIICQIAAILGIVLWRLTDNPNIAVLINITADFTGFLPTYRHALKAPYAETWQLFAISGISAALALVSIQHYSFIALASPTYIFLANMVISITIIVLRKHRGLPLDNVKASV